MKWFYKMRDDLKEEGYETIFYASQKEKKNFIEISGKERLFIALDFKQGVTTATFQSSKTDPDDLFADFFEDFDDLFDDVPIKRKTYPQKMQNIIINSLEECTNEVGNAMICLKGSKLNHFDLNESYQKPKTTHFHHKSFIKEFIPGMEKIVSGIHIALYKEIVERENEISTFIRTKDEKYSFYYEGAIGNITITFKDKTFYLKEKNQKEKYKINSKETMKDAINEILKKMHQKMRIKNLNTPPMYHWTAFAEKEDSIPDEIIKNMFDALSTKLSPKEIEEKSALEIKKEKGLKQTKYGKINIFIAFNYYLLTKNLDSFWVCLGKDEAKKKIKEIILSEIENDLDNTLSI